MNAGATSKKDPVIHLNGLCLKVAAKVHWKK
jgi:hypothetical protein